MRLIISDRSLCFSRNSKAHWGSHGVHTQPRVRVCMHVCLCVCMRARDDVHSSSFETGRLKQEMVIEHDQRGFDNYRAQCTKMLSASILDCVRVRVCMCKVVII